MLLVKAQQAAAPVQPDAAAAAAQLDGFYATGADFADIDFDNLDDLVLSDDHSLGGGDITADQNVGVQPQILALDPHVALQGRGTSALEISGEGHGMEITGTDLVIYGIGSGKLRIFGAITKVKVVGSNLEAMVDEPNTIDPPYDPNLEALR